MGIRFSCPACGRSLNVKAELAGKRGRCPHCQGKIVIPSGDGQGESVTADSADAASGTREEVASADTAAYVRPEEMPTVVNRAPAGMVARVIPAKAAEAATPAATETAAPPSPTGQPSANKVADFPAAHEASGPAAVPSSAPAPSPAAVPSPAPAADAISEAPQMQWYVMPPGAASQYGPAVGEEFRAWIAEGRVTGDSLVWRQDWPEWKRADAVFAQLQGPPMAPTPGIAVMPGIPVAGAVPIGAPLPTAGLPVGQLAHPVAGPPGVAAPAGGFPIADDRAAQAARRPARPYRQRSNTGPMIVIIALLVAMIPLSYFVYKVVSEQLASGGAAKTAVKADKPKPAAEGEPSKQDEPPAEDEPAASTNEAEE